MTTSCKAAVMLIVGMVLVSAGLVPSFADGSTKYDGTYAAYLSCAPLPYTEAMRNQPFVFTIKNGQLSYSRVVRMPNGINSSGANERGRGAVASDGSVSVSGAADGNGWSFTSQFQGQFDGATVHLTGSQSWNLPQPQGGGKFKRSCSITAKPQ